MAGGGDGGRAAGGPHDGGDGGAGGQCCCWAPRVDWRTHSRSRGRAGGRRGALVAGTLPEVGLQQRKEMVKVSLVMSGYNNHQKKIARKRRGVWGRGYTWPSPNGFPSCIIIYPSHGGLSRAQETDKMIGKETQKKYHYRLQYTT